MNRATLLLLTASLTLAGCAEMTSQRARRDSTPGMLPRGVLARWQHRVQADGMLPPNALVRAHDQRNLVQRSAEVPDGPSAVSAAAGLRNWQWRGPGNVGGRLRGIAIHPTSPATIWVAAAGGGVWKTTNSGTSWTPMNGFLPMLGVGCMTLDPADPNRLYVGTGEGGFFNNVTGSSKLAVPQGAGVFVSTDGAATFAQLASTAAWPWVNRLAIQPGNSQVLLAAISTGLMRSTDQGATWSQVTTTHAMDVDFHPTNGLLAIAGTITGQGLYSTDGGVTWTASTGITGATRIEVAYCRGSPTTVYAAATRNGVLAIYRSTNGGTSYVLQYSGGSITAYGNYINALWVDPIDPNTVVVAGVNVYRSTTGGTSPSSITGSIHPDHHVFVEDPGYDGTTNRTVWGGNDGGIYRTTNIRSSPVTWTEMNNGLGVTQFYSAAINPTTGVILAGAQDNGTSRYNGNPNGWAENVIGGDGAYCAADPTNSNYFYGSTQYLNVSRSSNGGSSFVGIAGSINEPTPNFITPFILDPNDSNRMLAGGAQLWRNTAVRTTSSWTSIKAAFSNCTTSLQSSPQAHFAVDPPCNISAIAVAPGDSNHIWVGHNDGSVFVTTNGTAGVPAWTRVDKTTPFLPNRQVARIAVDPSNKQRAYVGFQGYNNDNLWRTTDLGQTWSLIVGAGATGLPAVPITSVAVHQSVPGCLYVGTDVGVFWSGDDGATWATSGAGAGTAPIDELNWRDRKTLLVVTHGRGVFEADTFDTATVTTVGASCSVSGTLVLTATPPALGSSQAYTANGAAGNAPVSLLLSIGAASPTNYGNGCVLQTAVPIGALLGAGSTAANGMWSLSVSIPLDKSLADAILTAQVAIGAAGGPLLGVAELSNGLQLKVGL